MRDFRSEHECARKQIGTNEVELPFICEQKHSQVSEWHLFSCIGGAKVHFLSLIPQTKNTEIRIFTMKLLQFLLF